MIQNYNQIIQKLDQFIRKYYINKMLRGGLILIGIITAYFLAIALLENYFYFGTIVRKVLFYSFCGGAMYFICSLVLAPIFKYLRLGKTISNEQAAIIIGRHFSGVQDKLLNVLQLKKQYDSDANQTLLLASISQKTNELQPISFKKAIDLSKNKANLKYALPPLFILLTILLTAPSLIKKSTNRLINNNVDFEREAPFQFIIQNKNLAVPELESFELQVKIEGSSIPKEVKINYLGETFVMNPNGPGNFNYKFENVQQSIDFKMLAAGFEGKINKLQILSKANLSELKIYADYPTYIQRKDEIITNSGDLLIPFGTKLLYKIKTNHAEKVEFLFDKSKNSYALNPQPEIFEFLKTAIESQNYKIYFSNNQLPKSDSLTYSLTVVPDENPVITLEKFADSSNQKVIYLSGNVTDDYGLSRLTFCQEIKSENGKIIKRNVPIILPKHKQGFYSYLFDINQLSLHPGDEVNYYFEALDNDGLKGPKSAKTPMFFYKKPTIKETEIKIEKSTKEIENDLSKNIKESKKVNDEIGKLRDKLLQQKNINWQDKQKLEQLLEKQQELQKRIEDIQNKLQEKRKDENEVKDISPELKEKQDKVDELMKEIKDPAADQLMEKIKNLMSKLDKKESLKQMDQMQKQNEEMTKNMDRMLELLKQLELEVKVQEQIDKLNKLAEKEEKLSKETESNQKPQDKLQESQKEIKKEFEDIKKKMDEIQNENKDLKTPKKLDDQKDEQNEIDQNLDQSQENLENKENKKASKSQKSAAQKMENMAKNMKNDMDASEAEQIELDMKAIAQLLENIISLSFDQEKNIDAVAVTTINTPKYTSLTRKQMNQKSDFKIVDDSLTALSKRVLAIESFITKKVAEINNNLDDALSHLEERKKPESLLHQQSAMKNLNDLALMLSEVLQNMQMEMANKKPGDQMCNKPGGKKPGGMPKPGKGGSMPQMDKITEGQKNLSEKMKEQIGKLQQGKKPSSEQFGQMAQDQAKLRKQLQDFDKALREKGKGKQGFSDIIEAMNKIEKDLVNKKLTNEMIHRQQEIQIRLLEEERAQREQEKEEKRIAESAKNQPAKLSNSMLEYIQKKESTILEWQPISPTLNPYYQTLVKQYYNQVRK